jgi:RNA polymerase sigma factor (sigma-70 family)
LQHLQALGEARTAGDLSDGQLLERFCSRREETAFALLVQRHGPMVLAVCRRTLANVADVEDAFQATFLVLARRAASIRRRESVGSWLYGVAAHVALKARAQAARRRGREAQAVARTPAGPLAELTQQEVRAALDEELGRLPERYRAPVVLCDLKGKTHEQAAREMGCPKSSLSSRLVRARGLLRQRLVRRGIALSAGLTAAVLAEGATPVVVPALLTTAAVRHATLAGPGRAVASGLIPERVAALAEAGLRHLTAGGAKATMTLLLALGGVCLGTAVLAYQALAARPPAAEAGPPALAAGDGEPEGPGAEGRPRTDRYGDPLPSGAVGRLGTLRFRHQHTVVSLAFSRDGKTIVSGSWDQTVRLWDAATGRELHRFAWPHGDPVFSDTVSSAALSPDGKTVAEGCTTPELGGQPQPLVRQTVVLWDVATGRARWHTTNLENTVFHLRFTPDGKSLVGLSGRVIHVWDAASGNEQHRLTLPDGPGGGHVAFSPGGATAAAVCGDGTLGVWDVATGRRVRSFPGPQGGIACLALAPDGRTLASGGGEGDRTVRHWDLATEKELRRFGPYAECVTRLAFSPDGEELALADEHGTIRVCDVVGGKERCRCGLHAGNAVLALAFAPDGKTLAAGGTNEKAVRLFDTATGKERGPYAGHQDEITGLALLPDGDILVSAARDGCIDAWDLTGGRVVRRWGDPGGARAVALSQDGKALASGGTDGTARLWDLATGKELRRFRGPGGWVSGVAFSPDGTLLGAAIDAGPPAAWDVVLWDVTTGRERLRIRPPGPFAQNPCPFAFSPDGRTLVTGTGHQPGRPLCVWDLATGKELRRLPGDPDNDTLCLAFSPDGRLLASAGWSKKIRVTEVATGQTVRQFPAYAWVLAFSADGGTLASGDVDGTVSLWDLATGRKQAAFRGHSPGGQGRFNFAAGVSALAFSGDGKTLVSGGGDTTVLLWGLTGSAPQGRPRPAKPTPQQLDALWDALSSADAGKAEEAVWALAAAPGQAVPLLAEHVRPVSPADPGRVAELVAGLDSEQFQERQAATRQLEQLGEQALPGLRRALAGGPSPEVRRRLGELLDRPASPEQVRQLRAVGVLERAGTPEAGALLKQLAGGVPEARLTQDAKASLERLRRRAGRQASRPPPP